MGKNLMFNRTTCYRRQRQTDFMKTIIWKGINYDSLEYFKLTKHDDSDTYIADSKIIGCYEGKTYFIDYRLTINADWGIQSFQIESEVNSVKKTTIGEKKGNHWELNGVIETDFTDLKFIDISLTPFTNTLPIRNLKLEIGQHREIDVIYINILENNIKIGKQKYTKKGESIFKYENVPNDFEADIEVDELELVSFYPYLFEKLSEL
jgi:uncharacterized protein